MRRSLTSCALALLLIATAVTTADDPKPENTPKVIRANPDEPSEFEVTFADGSKVRMTVLESVITVKTKYGKLSIPIHELRRIDFGFRYPDGMEAKVDGAIASLGSSGFRDREEAEKTLEKCGEYSVPALKRATQSSDAEVVRRAEALLAKLAGRLTEERMNARDYDGVKTAEFYFRGRVEEGAIKVRTKQFGELSMKAAELRSIKSLFGGSASADLNLDAAKYAKQGWTTWLDTGVDVSTDAKLEIVCSGKIDQWIQSPGQYMSGPDGNGSYAPGTPAGGAVSAVGIGKKGLANPAGAVAAPRQWHAGAVIGRVGQKGELFVVGSNFKQAKAPGTGRLYLIIGPSNWNNDTVGSYKVKIKVGD